MILNINYITDQNQFSIGYITFFGDVKLGQTTELNQIPKEYTNVSDLKLRQTELHQISKGYTKFSEVKLKNDKKQNYISYRKGVSNYRTALIIKYVLALTFFYMLTNAKIVDSF